MVMLIAMAAVAVAVVRLCRFANSSKCRVGSGFGPPVYLGSDKRGVLTSAVAPGASSPRAAQRHAPQLGAREEKEGHA